ncbi:MAG: LiaF transmembrane domain-containing protein [Syntrophothermus sp.]
MENLVDKPVKQKDLKKFIFGFLVILAGLVLLAYNFGLIGYGIKHVVFSWPMLLIAIGVVSVSGDERSTPGYILILIGTFFLIPRMFDFDTARIFWPVLLIAIGMVVLFRRGIRDEFRRHRFSHPHAHHHGFEDKTSNLEEGYINESHLFSGSKYRIANQVFRGGKISNIFGGSEIDLTQAILGEGRNELVIECMFGGVTLIVPSDWRVVLNVSSIMGGFSDKRIIFRPDPNAPNYLVVKGTAIFGGGEIKSI